MAYLYKPGELASDQSDRTTELVAAFGILCRSSENSVTGTLCLQTALTYTQSTDPGASANNFGLTLVSRVVFN